MKTRRSATITRRTLLKSLAAGTAMATLPILQTRRLLAAPGDVPLRIVFFYMPSGVLSTRSKPLGRGGQAPTELEWELSPVFEPLAPFKDRINFFENLDMISARFDSTGPNNAHLGGSTHAMTGDVRVVGQGSSSSGISIDQYIAQQLEASGIITRIPSLDVGKCDAWLGKGIKVDTIEDAYNLYDRAFGALALTADEITAKQATRNFIDTQFQTSLKNLSAQDRRVIQAHQELRSKLFDRIAIRNPDRDKFAPSPDDFARLEQKWTDMSGGSNWKRDNGLYSDLIALALHSDTTRVASFGLNRPGHADFGYTSGNWGTSDPHDLEHKTAGSLMDNTGDFALDGPATLAQVRRNRTEIQVLADFLAQLQSMPETDGKTLLDHTLVVGVSHIASGSHSLQNLPWFTIGDAQGFFKTGHYFPFERTDEHRKYNGRRHNDLFVSLIQAMRLEAMPRSIMDPTPDRFGLADACNGPLSEMHM